MRFFKFETDAKKEDIINAFFNYIENEEHNIFTSYFKPYTSPRKGLHTYIVKEKISGYYENGVTTHSRTQLLSSKCWFFAKVKENTVKGFIIGDVYLLSAIFFYVFLALGSYFFDFNSDIIVNSSIVFILSLIFYCVSIREQKAIHKELKAIIKKAEWLSGNKKEG